MDAQEEKFYSAVQAVIEGDVARLASLLQADPGLSTARSPRNGAALLHYVAANGPVEDDLQKSPATAIEIARLLAKHGAEIDATIDEEPRSTPLVGLVTSGFTAEAGVQGGLVETFLAAGAAVNGLEDDGYPLACSLAFGYPDAIEALVTGGARISGLVAAAGLGRIDAVTDCFDGQGKLTAAAATYPDPFRRQFEPDEVIRIALEHAEREGHSAVVEFLSTKLGE